MPKSLAQEADYVWDTLHGVEPFLDSRISLASEEPEAPKQPEAAKEPEASPLAMPIDMPTPFEWFLIIATALSIRGLVA